MTLRFFIFSWNNQTIRYSNDPESKPEYIKEFGRKFLDASQYDLVIIGLQEDSIRDSPLIAGDNSLFSELLQPNYTLLSFVELSGWGVTTYKALKDDWEYRPRGLRLAVFKRVNSLIEITDIETNEMVCPGLRDWITAGKGGVAVTLSTNLGKVSFLNVHLPFSSRSILQDSINIRHDAVMWQAKCLRVLYENIERWQRPDYMFVFGDLNFRVQIRTEQGAAEIVERIFSEQGYIAELIREADELRLLIDYAKYVGDTEDTSESPPTIVNPPIPIFQEGIDNSGPDFYPTCKLKHHRSGDPSPDQYKLGQEDQRTPSWCDRILYKKFHADAQGIQCMMYDRWDYAEMNQSDHAAVIGEFVIN